MTYVMSDLHGHTDNPVILLPMILGWVIGFRFRKILDAERAAEDTETKDDP